MLWGMRLLTRAVERPIYYFLFPTIILLAEACAVTRKGDTTEKRFIYIGAFTLFGLLFLYRAYGNPNMLPYIPFFLTH